ncbi:MAG: UDP-N-acetylmuramoyl-tripeptide--D-alanyl-D-alanine ligase [Bacteroidetes bacterium]|nr:UDP-N-acetylmuramoyl-tripeptide--D-alanyl-D-alanine ligase [Bacteroidota bacterium]
MNFTVSDLLSAPHVRAIGFESLTERTRFSSVSTDSRQCGKGDLFIALRGETFDGHDFLAQIAKQGAAAAVVDAKWYRTHARKTPRKLPLLVVRDTLTAYGDLAQIYRNKFSIPILLVAGSNGKTTTKDVTSYVLGTSFTLLKTEANYNNHVGLPRMLFLLTPKHKLAVLEIGTNHPGEIARLTEIAMPTHGIITNIGREHLEFFKNLAGVAKEETALFRALDAAGGTAFVNLDDKYLAPSTKRFGKRAVTFATKGKAQVTARDRGFATNGKRLVDLTIGKQTIKLKTNIVAEYAPSLIASVASVAKEFGIPNAKIKSRIESYKPHSKRMEMITLPNGVLVINDCYNANPESFAAALETLKRIPAKGKKYVVAGDMFELGDTSTSEHTKLGAFIGTYRFDGHYFTGKAMKHAFAALLKKRKSATATYSDSKAGIAEDLRSLLKRGDVILLKGSRGMKMEDVLAKL